MIVKVVGVMRHLQMQDELNGTTSVFGGSSDGHIKSSLLLSTYIGIDLPPPLASLVSSWPAHQAAENVREQNCHDVVDFETI